MTITAESKFVELVRSWLVSLPHDLKIAFDAMARAKDLTGPSIRDQIAATKDFPGVTGIISIDQDHNAVKPANHFAGQCSTCHKVNSWKNAAFNHQAVNASDCQSVPSPNSSNCAGVYNGSLPESANASFFKAPHCFAFNNAIFLTTLWMP